MSSSFLNPSVTPRTALATKARARPCRARCSSDSRRALSTLSFCSKRMPWGTRTLSLPLGPCTSMTAGPICTFTPAGSGIGFRPIRDMAFCLLPDFAEQLAAEPLFTRRTAGHDSARSAQNAHSQAAEDALNLFHRHIAAAAGTGDAAKIGDDAALVRRVLQKDTQGLAGLRFVDDFISGDEALFFKH